MSDFGSQFIKAVEQSQNPQFIDEYNRMMQCIVSNPSFLMPLVELIECKCQGNMRACHHAVIILGRLITLCKEQIINQPTFYLPILHLTITSGDDYISNNCLFYTTILYNHNYFEPTMSSLQKWTSEKGISPYLFDFLVSIIPQSGDSLLSILDSSIMPMIMQGISSGPLRLRESALVFALSISQCIFENEAFLQQFFKALFEILPESVNNGSQRLLKFLIDLAMDDGLSGIESQLLSFGLTAMQNEEINLDTRIQCGFLCDLLLPSCSFSNGDELFAIFQAYFSLCISSFGNQTTIDDSNNFSAAGKLFTGFPSIIPSVWERVQQPISSDMRAVFATLCFFEGFFEAGGNRFPEIIPFLANCLTNVPDDSIRQLSINCIAEGRFDDPNLIFLIISSINTTKSIDELTLLSKVFRNLENTDPVFEPGYAMLSEFLKAGGEPDFTSASIDCMASLVTNSYRAFRIVAKEIAPFFFQVLSSGAVDMYGPALEGLTHICERYTLYFADLAPTFGQFVMTAIANNVPVVEVYTSFRSLISHFPQAINIPQILPILVERATPVVGEDSDESIGKIIEAALESLASIVRISPEDGLKAKMFELFGNNLKSAANAVAHSAQILAPHMAGEGPFIELIGRLSRTVAVDSALAIAGDLVRMNGIHSIDAIMPVMMEAAQRGISGEYSFFESENASPVAGMKFLCTIVDPSLQAQLEQFVSQFEKQLGEGCDIEQVDLIIEFLSKYSSIRPIPYLGELIKKGIEERESDAAIDGIERITAAENAGEILNFLRGIMGRSENLGTKEHCVVSIGKICDRLGIEWGDGLDLLPPSDQSLIDDTIELLKRRVMTKREEVSIVKLLQILLATANNGIIEFIKQAAPANIEALILQAAENDEYDVELLKRMLS